MSKLIEGRLKGSAGSVFLDYIEDKGSWEIFESATKKRKYISGDLSELQAVSFLERKYPGISFKMTLKESKKLEELNFFKNLFGKKDPADFSPEELQDIVQDKINQSKEMAKTKSISYETEFLNNLWLVLKGISKGNRELKGNRPVSYVLILKPEKDGTTTIIKGHGPLTVSKTKLPFSKDDKDYTTNEKSLFNILTKKYNLKTSAKDPDLPVVMKCKDPNGVDCIAFLGKHQGSSEIISKAIGGLLKANNLNLSEDSKLESLKGWKIIKGLSPDAGSEGRNVHFPATKEELDSGITMISKFFDTKDLTQAVQQVADGDITPEELNKAMVQSAKDGTGDIQDALEDVTDSDEVKKEEPGEDENLDDIYGIFTGDSNPQAEFTTYSDEDGQDYTINFKANKNMNNPADGQIRVTGPDPEIADSLRQKVRQLKSKLKGQPEDDSAFLGSAGAIMSKIDSDQQFTVEDEFDLKNKKKTVSDLTFNTSTGEFDDDAFDSKKLSKFTPDEDYLDSIKVLFKDDEEEDEDESEKDGSADKKEEPENSEEKDSDKEDGKDEVLAIEDKSEKKDDKEKDSKEDSNEPVDGVLALPEPMTIKKAVEKIESVDDLQGKAFEEATLNVDVKDDVKVYKTVFTFKDGKVSVTVDGKEELQPEYKELEKALTLANHKDIKTLAMALKMFLRTLSKGSEERIAKGQDPLYQVVDMNLEFNIGESYKRAKAINNLLRRINKVL